MTLRDNSFTVNIIPHDANRTRREWIITGRKLIMFRILLVISALMVCFSAVVLITGADELSRSLELSEENKLLSDSLSKARELNNRLDGLEEELQEIRNTREIIENLATAGTPAEQQE